MCFEYNIQQYLTILLLFVAGFIFLGFDQDMPGPRLYALFAKDFTQLCRCVQNLEESRVFKPGKTWVKHGWLILVTHVTRVSWICSLAFWTGTYVRDCWPGWSESCLRHQRKWPVHASDVAA